MSLAAYGAYNRFMGLLQQILCTFGLHIEYRWYDVRRTAWVWSCKECEAVLFTEKDEGAVD